MDLKGLIDQYRDQMTDKLVFHYFPDERLPVQPSFSRDISDEIIVWGQPDLPCSLLDERLQAGYKIVILPSTNLNLEKVDEFNFLKHPSVTVVVSKLVDYQKLLPFKDVRQLFFHPADFLYLHKKVILLMRDQNRVDHVQKKLMEPLSNIHVFPATDAQIPGALDSFLERQGLYVSAPLKAGLVGCFCSHYRIWQSLLKSEEPAWIVLEDDVIPVALDIFSKNLKEILNELSITFDLVYLYLSPQYYRNDSSVHIPGKKALNKAYSNSNSSAYLLSRKGASLLLDYCSCYSLSESVDQILTRLAQTENFEAYSAKYLLFDNIGLKAIQLKKELQEGKLSSNIANSQVYRPSTPKSASNMSVGKFIKSMFQA